MPSFFASFIKNKRVFHKREEDSPTVVSLMKEWRALALIFWSSMNWGGSEGHFTIWSGSQFGGKEKGGSPLFVFSLFLLPLLAGISIAAYFYIGWGIIEI